MKVDTKKYFAALFIFCATVIAMGVHDYKQGDQVLFETVAKSLLIFMGALPFMLLYRNILSRKVADLSQKMDVQNEKLYETTNLLEEKVEEKTKELLDEGFKDPLTHLSNRHRLMFDIDRYAYRTLIIVHLQNFKELNNFFGSKIGDSLLQEFALWLERLNYNAYRLGNDEFALLIQAQLSQKEVAEYCDEFTYQLFQHPFIAGMEKVSLYANMGVHVGDKLSLMHADTALKSAIELSKTFAIYEAYNEEESQHQHNIQTAKNIREAFHTGRIICYYQPIISTITGDIEKYETLARLIDTNAAIIPPHDFLYVAQKTRLYPEITQIIVAQACETFQDRSENFTVHLCIQDITDHSTIHFIEKMVVSTNTANRIIFELSEQDIYEHYVPMTLFIQHIKRLGSKIAIDNFGSSYSNFDKLLHLDIDYLKIDGSLINKIMHSQRHTQIIQTIATFAEAIGAKAIAENVESAEILQNVTTIGIPYAQGYYIGKPGPCCFE
ncbi:MAG: bifunctional diguanylate cyclase/phosphodiesterase [Sulfuricurvum sp.]|nr:bifunctional diguanylate cyclase/phosphodiesterase [Sulfuricurvum sp.]MDP3021606.1 bifunctional diguanylate cyclase/phosphodiesterase [Sulfuricurvum sp.]MDP3119979.1 bifunctional diguanylate cyclase/phosphodiesterase [Sulfuricurvum sp.]